jgi:hypothetical protein
VAERESFMQYFIYDNQDNLIGKVEADNDTAVSEWMYNQYGEDRFDMSFEKCGEYVWSDVKLLATL